MKQTVTIFLLGEILPDTGIVRHADVWNPNQLDGEDAMATNGTISVLAALQGVFLPTRFSNY